AVLAILAVGAGAFQAAKAVRIPSVKVQGAWARPALEGGNTAVYLTIANEEGAPLRLVAAEVDVAEAAELHESSIGADHVMRMHPVEAIELPAGATVELRQGGLHIMVLGLDKPLFEGDHFLVRLVFEGYDPVSIAVPVRLAPESADHGHP